MKTTFTSQRNVQIVISLMKVNGIRRVITSPGMTNVAINMSLQHDPYFTLYSCVDERSAAYMACGMAAETNEPVALTCTGATSSRNYMPGMTEAYYRHLPILAITCSQPSCRIGHYMNQVTDRTLLPRDVANVSVTAELIKNAEDEWDVTNNVNRAIIGLSRNGGGPCHINLEIGVTGTDFTTTEILPARLIKYLDFKDKTQLPAMPKSRIAVFVGQHGVWTDELTKTVERFCESNNSVVFMDNTSNYKGKYGVLIPLIADQAEYQYGSGPIDIDLLIHIGYVSHVIGLKPKEIWRVNEDGELRDTFKHLTAVFATDELSFFKHYATDVMQDMSLYKEYSEQDDKLRDLIQELPFSNLWIANRIAPKLPSGSTLHLGIRNSLRSYDYFKIPENVSVFSNTGGFGIDGGISSLIGASFIHPDKLYFGVFGDLLFFYDMNSIGNRDINTNLRIMVVNNGLGQEFKNYSCGAARFGEEVDSYVAARGHYGNKSSIVIKSYADSLGFKYLTASNKEEFENCIAEFIDPRIGNHPILFEIFTKSENENKALEQITNLSTKSKMLTMAKGVLRNEHLAGVKNVLKRLKKD